MASAVIIGISSKGHTCVQVIVESQSFFYMLLKVHTTV